MHPPGAAIAGHYLWARSARTARGRLRIRCSRAVQRAHDARARALCRLQARARSRAAVLLARSLEQVRRGHPPDAAIAGHFGLGRLAPHAAACVCVARALCGGAHDARAGALCWCGAEGESRTAAVLIRTSDSSVEQSAIGELSCCLPLEQRHVLTAAPVHGTRSLDVVELSGTCDRLPCRCGAEGESCTAAVVIRTSDSSVEQGAISCGR